MNERSYETLLYSITANVVSKLIEQNGWSEELAMERFVNSKVYSMLEKEETKVWQYSTMMLVRLYSDERAGRLCLPEV